MRNHRSLLLEPRKTPVQARSAASVESILEATVQVLLSVGKERLTTTRVAHRAGVSVGTLYQYFPNKIALLQAALRRHLGSIARAVEQAQGACDGSISEKVTRIVDAYLEAKMKDLKTSRAFYSVVSDVEGTKIAQETASRLNGAILSALENASEPLENDPQLLATMIQAAMAGVTRQLLESDSPEEQYPALRRELASMVGAYLEVSTSRRKLKISGGKPASAAPKLKIDRAADGEVSPKLVV